MIWQKSKEKSISTAERLEAIQRQFENLDTKDPSAWPALPKVILCVFIAAAVAIIAWLLLQDYEVQLEEERSKELVCGRTIKRNL